MVSLSAGCFHVGLKMSQKINCENCFCKREGVSPWCCLSPETIFVCPCIGCLIILPFENTEVTDVLDYLRILILLSLMKNANASLRPLHLHSCGGRPGATHHLQGVWGSRFVHPIDVGVSIQRGWDRTWEAAMSLQPRTGKPHGAGNDVLGAAMNLRRSGLDPRYGIQAQRQASTVPAGQTELGIAAAVTSRPGGRRRGGGAPPGGGGRAAC